MALTRSHEDNAEVGALLECHGLSWISLPCIATRPLRPPDALLEELCASGPLDAVAFPSRRAVAALLEAPAVLRALGLRPQALLVAAVGPGTREALVERGWPVTLEPEEKTGAALAEALAQVLHAGARVLLPGGDRARPELPQGLRARGLVPLPLTVYAHVTDAPPPVIPIPPAVVLSASPSAAKAFLAGNPSLREVPFVAIGATTEAALRRLGATRVTRASRPTAEAMVEALLNALGLQPDAAPPGRRTGEGTAGSEGST